ncbi:MAG: hypothetical protein IT429_22925, partial [Gemmataceae bacterium]|nr:hypothetical protein [Gemmataceae bacterium]
MRRVVSCLAFGGLLALAGCNNTRLGVINRGPSVPPQASTQVPTVKALVDYMDNNAQLVQGLASDDVTLSVHQGLKPIPNLRARLACQRPRNFRLTAELLSSTEVDIGSNQQEFWFWLKRAEPPAQYFCTYQDLSAGRVRVLPFPFQPEWVAETLGV